jgi:cobaltochelatase CobT
LCENADGESILIQSSELMKQKQARKIMIVLSDGAPSAPDAKDSHRGCDTYTRDVIQQIERDGLIEIYAIGIADRSVSEFYSNYDVINDASELESKLLNVLKNKFIGSL